MRGTRVVAPVAGMLAVVVLGIAVEAGDAGAVVEGRVVDAAGRAIPGVWICREGHRDRVGGVPWWRSDSEGKFKVDGVPSGKVVLRVVPGDADIRVGQLVETTSGATDVKVVVDPGPQLFVRISDYDAPEGDPRYARLTWLEPDGRRSVRYAPVGSNGATRFVRLPKDRDLELWGLAGSGKPVHSTGLRAGDETVAVAPVAGREIRGKLVVPAGDSVRRASVAAEVHRGFHVGRVKLDEDGTFSIRDLPEGTYRISAWFSSGAVSVPVVKEIRAGTTDVVFEIRN